MDQMRMKAEGRIEAEGPYSLIVSRLTWIYGCRRLGYSPRRACWVTAESALGRMN